MATGALRAAVGPEQALAERRPARQDHRRLADERPLRRAVRRAADHHGGDTPASTRRATPRSQPERRAQACSAASARASCTSIPPVYSLPAAGVQGNMTRNSGPEGPGFWQLDGSLFKRFSDRRRPLRRVPHRCLQRDELGALGQPEHRLQHRDRQHVRPDHRHHRRPAQRPVRRAVRVLERRICGFAVRGSVGFGNGRAGSEAIRG